MVQGDADTFGRLSQVSFLHIFEIVFFITFFRSRESRTTVDRHHHAAAFTVIDSLHQVLIRLYRFNFAALVLDKIFYPDIILAGSKGKAFFNLQAVVVKQQRHY